MKLNANYYPYPSSRTSLHTKNGMVVSTTPEASNVGLDILKKGGNAVDAAVAMAAALTVTEPTSNGIGGDCFAIVWMKGEMYGLNASGPAPGSISADAVKSLGHEKMPIKGWVPVTVPGAPAGWAALIEKFGNLTLKQCLEPAIKLAKEGFVVSPTVSHYFKRAKKSYAEFEEWNKVFGNAPNPGEIYKLPYHAETLEEIAKTNAESFYRGEIAKKIAKSSEKGGGFLKLSDLENYKPKWTTPISAKYRGYDVWELPPNGQGIAALIGLSILDGFNFTHKEDKETYHKQFEAMKLAFTATKKTVTDSSYMKYKPQQLLEEGYIKELRSKIKDYAIDAEAPLPKSGTVYLATADKEGNMVSFIQSNYMGFGSGIVIENTGIAMQNRGADFSLNKEDANYLIGGKQSYHTIIPGFLTKDGEAVGPFGVMGGYMQPQGHIQVILNTIDFGLNPQAALDAPRWQWTSGKKFMLEYGFDINIAKELRELGHEVYIEMESGHFGRGGIIWRDREQGTFIGGTEKRADGTILGY